MSHVLQSSNINIDDFFGVLYELVKPMLASENCVKCVTQDGNIIFTSDVGHLLSSLDIQHIAGELVAQALQSHKHTFGTGTKTLLFMIASLAKAVTQLRELSIPSEKSLYVINMIFADLSKEVEEISIITQDNLHLSHEENRRELYSQSFTTEENCSLTAKPEQMPSYDAFLTYTDQKNDESIYHCFNKENQLFQSNEIMHEEYTCNLTGEKLLNHKTAPLFANSDPVYLKMSNMQDLSNNTDDIEWFFDRSSSNQSCTPVTKDIHKNDYNCKDIPDCSGYQRFSSTGVGNSLKDLNINATVKTQTGSYTSKSILGSMNWDHDLLSGSSTPTLRGSGHHDIDFEDCFDEPEKKPFFEVNKSITSDNICNNDNVLFKDDISAHTHVPQSHESDMFSTLDKQCVSESSLNEVSAQQLVHSKDCKKSLTGDGSRDSIDAILNPSKALDIGCEHPYSPHVSEALNTSKQKSNAFPAEISNKLLATSCVEPVSVSDHPCNNAARRENVEELGLPDLKSVEHQINNVEELGLPDLKSVEHQINNVEELGLPDLKSVEHQITNVEELGLPDLKPVEHQINNVAKTTAICEKSSLNLPDGIYCSVNQEETKYFGDKSCCASSLASDYISNGQCDNQDYIRGNVGNELHEKLSKGCSDGAYSYGGVNPTLAASTDTEVTDIRFNEQASTNKINGHKHKEMLLDYLLLQKKAQSRSSLGTRVKTSSRHLYNSSKSSLNSTPPPHKACNLTELTVNMAATDLNTLTSDLNNMNPDIDRENSNKQSLPHLLNNSPFSTPELSDLKLKNHDQIHNLHAKPCNQTEKLTTDCLEDSAFCVCGRASCGLSGKAKQMKPLEVTAYLHDCCGDVADAAMLIALNQRKKSENQRFNFELVECLSLPSAASSVSVVSGLAIPCGNHVLEKLEIGVQPLLALLINADLDSHFHHKGYKPLISKRTLIATPSDGSRESEERLWCMKALNIIRHLNVKLVLVKGKASSVLLDMCDGAGVLVLTNISYHTLSVLSHLHRVDMVSYITLASEENLCNLCLAPLSAEWRDHLQKEKSPQNRAKYFALVTNTLDVQTVLLHCPSTMSAQLAEERFWKCLHSIVNAQADAKVLPGAGKTETWCADRIHCKYESALASQSQVQSVILEAVADMFHDYCQTVSRNTLQEMGHNRNNIKIPNCCSTFAGDKKMPLPYSSKSNYISHQNTTVPGSETDKEDFKCVCGLDCMQNCHWNKVSNNFISASESTVYRFTNELYQHSFSELNTTVETKESQGTDRTHNSLTEHHIYDNFQSKVSAWMTAVDLVSVLQNLGCLVISGVDSKDITEDMALL